MRIGHTCAEEGTGAGGEGGVYECNGRRERGELPRYNIPAYDNITTNSLAPRLL
jgi:hypothetical protein